MDKEIKYINKYILNNKHKFMIIEIPYNKLEKGIKTSLIEYPTLLKSIFMLFNTDYRQIKSDLLYKFNISGGSNTKKYILSPV